MNNDILKKIERSQLFCNIEEKEIASLITNIKYFIRKYEKGEVIAHEDDECNTLALVLDGKVEIQRLFSNGKYLVLNKLSDGDVFGEALVFSSEKVYPASVISLSESTILCIKREDVLKLCAISNTLLENFISLLSDKVFILNSKVKSIAFRGIRQRVINFLLGEVKKQKSNYIVLKRTKEEIAAALAMPRPSLSRELINLKEEGYIDFDRKNITVFNLEKLEEELFN